MFCVTGVYLRHVTNIIFFNFALECDSSECLLLLFKWEITHNEHMFLCILFQTAKTHQKFSPHEWKLDEINFFSQVEAFIQRCKDLLEV